MVLSKNILFRVNQIAQQIPPPPTIILDFIFLLIPSNHPAKRLWTLVGGIKLQETWTTLHTNLAKWHSKNRCWIDSQKQHFLSPCHVALLNCPSLKLLLYISIIAFFQLFFPKAFLDGHSDFVIINGRYCYYERGRLTQDNFEIEEVSDIVVSQVQLGLLVALLFRDRRPCHTLRGSTDGAMISSIVGCMHERSYQRVRSSPGCWWRTSMGG